MFTSSSKNVSSKLNMVLSSTFNIRNISIISKFPSKKKKKKVKEIWVIFFVIFFSVLSFSWIHTHKWALSLQVSPKCGVTSIAGDECITLLKWRKILTAGYLKVTQVQKITCISLCLHICSQFLKTTIFSDLSSLRTDQQTAPRNHLWTYCS